MPTLASGEKDLTRKQIMCKLNFCMQLQNIIFDNFQEFSSCGDIT